MKKEFSVVLFVVVIVGIVALALKIRGGRTSPEATQASTAQITSPPVALSPLPTSTAQAADPSLKTINIEQESQADRCKNGYADACDKERAIAEFKKALGQ